MTIAGDTTTSTPTATAVGEELAVQSEARTESRPWDISRRTALLLLPIPVAAGAVLRLVNLNALGFNSDEVVYAGQAASLAGNPLYTETFQVFRAHPMLVQTLLSFFYRHGEQDIVGRVVVALLGVATLVVIYLLGAEFYTRATGLLAASLVAVMPYHVVVTRQVLLDGPMVFFACLTLLCLARFARTQRLSWYLAAGGVMGLTMLAKESSVVLLGAVYAFLALTPTVRRPVLKSAAALIVLVAVFAMHPVSTSFAGGSESGKAYFVWQLLRRGNHDLGFYGATVPWAVGLMVLAAAVGGLWWGRNRQNPWREVLLGSWIVVPVVAFELWPVKGFQYLLPIVPALAVLAARGLLTLRVPRFVTAVGVVMFPRMLRAVTPRALQVTAIILVVVSLVPVSVGQVFNTNATEFLAGTGGVPGGREAGHWMARNTPAEVTVLTLGPSMANIIQYYGHRKSYGLSVSPNPLHRNPSYEAIVNPDRQMRQGDLQYAIWDTFSAGRSPHFSEHLMALIRRYHGRAVHTEYVTVADRSGRPTRVPVVVIYEVRP